MYILTLYRKVCTLQNSSFLLLFRHFLVYHYNIQCGRFRFFFVFSTHQIEATIIFPCTVAHQNHISYRFCRCCGLFANPFYFHGFKLDNRLIARLIVKFRCLYFVTVVDYRILSARFVEATFGVYV